VQIVGLAANIKEQGLFFVQFGFEGVEPAAVIR
jgi:hypothetical protein